MKGRYFFSYWLLCSISANLICATAFIHLILLLNGALLDLQEKYDFFLMIYKQRVKEYVPFYKVKEKKIVV